MKSFSKQKLQKSVTFMLFVLSIALSPAYSQTVNANWKQDLNNALQQFLNCQTSGESNSCNKFLGESLNKIYNINDFYSQKSGRYMMTSEIAAFLNGNSKWTKLGPCYEQKTLTTAQELANAKKAVVAVYMNASGMGHVVVITPGQLQPSGSWGFNVPSAVSFFPAQPDKSFVDKGLSFAFTKNMMKDIQLYARNY